MIRQNLPIIGRLLKRRE